MSERYTPNLDKNFEAPTMPQGIEINKKSPEVLQVIDSVKEIGDQIDRLEQTYQSTQDSEVKIAIKNNLRVLAEFMIRASNRCK